jgi:DNA-directed RNA polymerase specialized sigma24 family protein
MEGKGTPLVLPRECEDTRRRMERHMTRDEYGAAYQKGYRLTVRFLVSRGSTWDDAEEAAQAAWARGWECLKQLRDGRMVLTWVNTIAMNIRRGLLRREPVMLHLLPEIQVSPKINLAAVDVNRILRCSRKKDRIVLERHLAGFNAQEIASEHGWTEMAVKNRLFRARRSAGERFGQASRQRSAALAPDAAAAA